MLNATASSSIGQVLRCYVMFIAAIVFGFTPYANAQERSEITVIADSNLSIPLTLIARDYARKNQVSMSVIARQSANITQQIRDGLPVDVVLTSHRPTLTSLHQSGLVDLDFGKSFLHDQPVIARSKRHDTGAAFDERFIADYALFILEPNHDPALMLAFDAAKALHEKTETSTTAHQNIAALLEALTSTKHLAILPASLASQHETLQTISTLPVAEHSDGIEYRAEVVASEHMRAARAFVEYLNSQSAREIFEQYGFALSGA